MQPWTLLRPFLSGSLGRTAWLFFGATLNSLVFFYHFNKFAPFIWGTPERPGRRSHAGAWERSMIEGQPVKAKLFSFLRRWAESSHCARNE
jgi:hypothetical protein